MVERILGDDRSAVATPRSLPESREPPDATVIVVSYNTEHLLKRMFDALEASRGTLQIQIIVVDNASRDGSVHFLRTKYPTVELIENKTNVGFGRANNQAVPRARGRYVLLLNTDAFMSPDTLPKTVTYMDAHPQCGVLGVKLIDSNGSLAPSCRYFPTPWNVFVATTGCSKFFPATRLVDDMSWDHESERQCDWVPGCYYLVRREVIERIGLFDPRYFLYWEEVDHCRAVRVAGWSIVYYPYTEVVHIGGESSVSDGATPKGNRQVSTLRVESELLYFRKQHGIFGLFAAVILGVIADVIIGSKAVIRRLDFAAAASATFHISIRLKVLIKTRLASGPTR
jgi:N-acetylglucosaminyl-diphospho-decaprenol L-rhamnosyltransferase